MKEQGATDLKANSQETEALILSRVDSNKGHDVEASKSQLTAGQGLFMGMGMTTAIIVYYSLCSSTMLVINKVAIYYLPCPNFVLCCQLLASALTVVIGDKSGILVADKIEWEKVKKFVFVVVGFLGTIFANMKVLQNSNVETFITFRSSTPLVLSLCDYFFLGRALPCARSWASLLVLLAGAGGYVMVDTGYRVDAYYWLALWYAFFIFDCVYVKHMCDTVKMTNWGRVLYTNGMALVPLAFMLPMYGEHVRLAQVVWTPGVVLPLLLSCVVGVCMSHASYLLREATSATLFTIVGILCKVLTVVINVMIWDKHATPMGIGFLLVCVTAGTFYKQAPKRAT